jgi:hypothetical protein
MAIDKPAKKGHPSTVFPESGMRAESEQSKRTGSEIVLKCQERKKNALDISLEQTLSFRGLPSEVRHWHLA